MLKLMESTYASAAYGDGTRSVAGNVSRSAVIGVENFDLHDIDM